MVGGGPVRSYESVIGPAADLPSVVNIQMVNFVLCVYLDGLPCTLKTNTRVCLEIVQAQNNDVGP
jgi:hypothetical protein